MANSRAASLLHHVRELLAEREIGSDAELLDRFVLQSDERAFTALMRRHAPLVLGVCRRTLQHEQDAEDAFQATFLVLARRAKAIRRRASLASWLYGVAHRLAMKARAAAARRLHHEKQVLPSPVPDSAAEVTWGELRQVLDEELARLPEKLRAPLLLCYLDGQTQDEASRQLACKTRTIKARLALGRKLLRDRLERRGLTLSMVLAGPLVGSDVIPPSSVLCQSTARAAKMFAAKELLGSAVSARVLALANGGLRAMFVPKLFGAVLVLSAAVLLAGGTAALVVSRPTPTPLTAASALDDEASKKSHTDRWGDPLPGGASARLGTTRFRIGGKGLGFLPDNKTLISHGGYLNRTEGHLIRFWDTQTGKFLREIDTTPLTMRGFTVSRDGKYVAAGGFLPDKGNLPTPGAVGIWEMSSGKNLRTLQRSDRDVDSCSLAFTPDDKLLVSIGDSGILRIEEVETGVEILRHQFPRDILPALAVSPDGAIIAISSGPNTRKLFLWNWQTGEEPRELPVRDRVGQVLVFSPEGRHLAECRGCGRGLRIWDVPTGQFVQELEPPEPDYHSTNQIVYAPDGRTFVTASQGNTSGAVDLWDRATAKPIRRLVGEEIPVTSLNISPDGRLLAGISGAQLRVWDLTSSNELTTADTGHRDAPSKIAVTPDGLVVTAGDDHTMRVWESTTGKQLRKMAHGNWIRDIAVSPDGTKLVSSSLDDTVCLWDLATGEIIYRLPGHGKLGGRRAVAFTPDGKSFVSWGDDMYVRKWEVATGKAVLEHRLRPVGVSVPGEESEPYEREMFFHLGEGTFSPDGNSFVVNLGAQFHIFDVASGKETGTIANEGSTVISMAVSSDSELLLASAWGKPVETKLTDGRTRSSAGENHPVCVWDLASGKLLKRVVLPAGGVGPVAFSPDGKLFAAAANEPNRIVLWAVAGGKEVRVITGFRRSVRSLAFLPDGKHLVSGMDDTTALVWDLTDNPRRSAAP
jgi:RNA polymerase sigma factor (sigma-70 family)